MKNYVVTILCCVSFNGAFGMKIENATPYPIDISFMIQDQDSNSLGAQEVRNLAISYKHHVPKTSYNYDLPNIVYKIPGYQRVARTIPAHKSIDEPHMTSVAYNPVELVVVEPGKRVKIDARLIEKHKHTVLSIIPWGASYKVIHLIQ